MQSSTPEVEMPLFREFVIIGCITGCHFDLFFVVSEKIVAKIVTFLLPTLINLIKMTTITFK